MTGLPYTRSVTCVVLGPVWATFSAQSGAPSEQATSTATTPAPILPPARMRKIKTFSAVITLGCAVALAGCGGGKGGAKGTTDAARAPPATPDPAACHPADPPHPRGR